MTVFLSMESWEFICKHLYPVVHPMQYSKSQTKAYQFCDLSLVTKTTAVSHTMLRTADEESLEAARKLFGRTFGVGC
jgi:hypothetical protein